MWATYQFSFGPLLNKHQSLVADHWLAYRVGSHWVAKTLHSALHLSIPAPEFFNGILHLLNLNHEGHPSYFLGHSQLSSPWFFPVILSIKTPLAFLLLVFISLIVVCIKQRDIRSHLFLPILISFALVLICVSSNLNFGVRHILPIYPFLAMLAASGAVWFSNKRMAYGIFIPFVLLGWIVISNIHYGKDSLAYFNEIGSTRPEYFSLDSDLDWGQDIDKLEDTLRNHEVPYLVVSYHGSADLVRHGFPLFDTLRPFNRIDTGWVAVSKWNLYATKGYEWLRRKKPFARVGNSILLYHF